MLNRVMAPMLNRVMAPMLNHVMAPMLNHVMAPSKKVQCVFVSFLFVSVEYQAFREQLL